MFRDVSGLTGQHVCIRR